MNQELVQQGGLNVFVYGFKNGKILFSKKDDTKTDSSDKQTDVLDTLKKKDLMIS